MRHVKVTGISPTEVYKTTVIIVLTKKPRTVRVNKLEKGVLVSLRKIFLS